MPLPLAVVRVIWVPVAEKAVWDEAGAVAGRPIKVRGQRRVLDGVCAPRRVQLHDVALSHVRGLWPVTGAGEHTVKGLMPPVLRKRIHLRGVYGKCACGKCTPAVASCGTRPLCGGSRLQRHA